MDRRLPALLVVAAALVAPGAARAEQTLKPVTVHGRAAKPSVVIEIKREAPSVGLRPLAPPKSFVQSQ
jgi:hypothetical protein